MRAKTIRSTFLALQAEKRFAAVRDNEMRAAKRDLQQLKKRDRQRRRELRRKRRERGA